VIVDEEKVNAGDQTRDDHQMIRIRKPMGETNRPEARSDRSESDSRFEFNEDEEEKDKRTAATATETEQQSAAAAVLWDDL
jgi:hypothetical protein